MMEKISNSSDGSLFVSDEQANTMLALALAEALLVIAGRCDGACRRDHQGFSAWDVGWGEMARREDPAKWSLRKIQKARHVVFKYRRQLAEEGLDVALLPEVRFPRVRTVEIVGRVFVLSWVVGDPDFDEIKEAVKAVPQRRWDGDGRKWTVPVWQAAKLAPVVDRFEFEVSPEAEAELVSGEPESPVVAERAERNGHIALELAEWDGEDELAVLIKMRYDAQAVAKIKAWWAPGDRQWDHEDRVWRLFVRDITAKRVFQLAEEHSLEVGDRVRAEVERLARGLEEARAAGAPCLGRSCDDCDVDAAVCPSRRGRK